ncbi:hypothetical protein ANCCAN_17473 [Ancylostoma caninum]|uniref:Uncharacterized protein n=1 Tax=Ancylostoma caninum TaxID=29170 RepID=A0A368FWZ0_ANCCA|nr:hypothetical protein ANCCAN_17473 [Ancylostoma caninum]
MLRNAKFITSEMTYLGIGFASYVDEPRGVVVSYVNEKDIPLHAKGDLSAVELYTGSEAISPSIKAENDISDVKPPATKFGASSPPQVIEAKGDLSAVELYTGSEAISPSIKAENDISDVKPPATKFGASSPPQVIEAKGDLSAVELYTGSEAISPSIKAENDISDVKPPAFPSGTLSTPDMIDVKVDNSAKECVDSTVENREETNPALLKKVFAVSGERLLTLFRFCPECGTEISRKRSAVLSEEGPSPVVHFVCKNCQGKQSWYGM